jgi:hypothetical protein
MSARAGAGVRVSIMLEVDSVAHTEEQLVQVLEKPPFPAERSLTAGATNELTVSVVTLMAQDKPEVVTRFRHCEQVLSRP